MATHYVYGSGMSGCLYDNGPHTSSDIEHAIQALEESFSELPKAELRRMRANLKRTGIHYFKGKAREQACADYCDIQEHESGPKIAALAEHLSVSYGSITEEGNGTWYECEEQRGEWYVLDSEERETMADELLENYIDECLEMPDAIRPYFDSAKWKRDALMSDGYGHTLASYDGHEHEVTIDGVWYFIYRTG